MLNLRNTCADADLQRFGYKCGDIMDYFDNILENGWYEDGSYCEKCDCRSILMSGYITLKNYNKISILNTVYIFFHIEIVQSDPRIYVCRHSRLFL